jgi:phosphoglycolate phosphatase-like HAD superfamily hydrolase
VVAVRVAVELDALGDTRPLWHDWLEDTARILDVAGLPEDRSAAAVELDARGSGNWRTLLERFAEDRAPVYLRPAAEVSAALRGLQAAGARVGVFTDAPAELARVALAQLGAARRVEVVEAGEGALERLLAALGADAVVVRTRTELVTLDSR